MIYYRSYRIIDGKPKLVVIDEDGNIIKNPTKEQKKEAILEGHKNRETKGRIEGRMCCRCNTDLSSGIPEYWIIPNEGWVCNLSNIDVYKTFRPSKYDQFKVDPKSYNDAYKSLMSYLGDRKFFGIEDIKKWLSIS